MHQRWQQGRKEAFHRIAFVDVERRWLVEERREVNAPVREHGIRYEEIDL